MGGVSPKNGGCQPDLQANFMNNSGAHSTQYLKRGVGDEPVLQLPSQATIPTTSATASGQQTTTASGYL